MLLKGSGADWPLGAPGRFPVAWWLIWQKGWELEQTATQKYQSAQKYNSVFSIGIFNVLILAFRHFRICFKYICMNYRFVQSNLGYLRNKNIMRWLFCNRAGTVNNTRPTGKEVTGTRKREWHRYWRKCRKGKGKWRCSSKENAYFPRPQLKTWTFLCDGQTNWLICLPMFQNLLWMYGMAWMSVRFPGLKLCPSTPLKEAMNWETKIPLIFWHISGHCTM